MYHYVVGEIARRGRHPRRVLDVGCSVGYGSFILSRGSDQISVIGIDIEQQKIEDARRLFDADRIGFRQLDIVDSRDVRRLIDEAGRFDVVVCFEVLEHIPPEDSEKMLQNLRDVLKDDGLLFISTPNKSIYDIGAFTKDHVNELRHDELLALLRNAGFDILEVKGIQKKSKISSSLLLKFGLVERSGDKKVALDKARRLLRRMIVLLFDRKTSFGFLLSRMSKTRHFKWKFRTAINSTPQWSIAVLVRASGKEAH